jgi:hypothetical protein
MSLIRDRSIHTAVERDGLPRVAAYDDGVDRVLFLDGEIVRSVEASAWTDVLPTDPTPRCSGASGRATWQRLPSASKSARSHRAKSRRCWGCCSGRRGRWMMGC